MTTTTIPVQWNCKACEKILTMSLVEIKGVMEHSIKGASSQKREGNCIVTFDENITSEKQIKEAIPKNYLR